MSTRLLFFCSILLWLLWSSVAFPQSVQVQGMVTDADSGYALSYATVRNLRSHKGTATNLQGAFILPENKPGDTLQISYIGYQSQKKVVQASASWTIALRPSPPTLDEVVITTDNDYLYDLLLKAKRNGTDEIVKAKTYFFLETYLDGQMSELIEAYYNGQYEGYKVTDLNIKKGRIGVKSVNQKYFVSTESSKIFLLHNIFLSDPLFPDNPLIFGRKKLKKSYDLSLEEIFMEGESRIYVIDCVPREASKELFTTRLWLDMTHEQIRKINFRVNQTYRHPFDLLGDEKIGHVSMNITRNYQRTGEAVNLETIDFSYDLTYMGREGMQNAARTTAYLRAYDYQEAFEPPRFTFTRALLQDYRDITVAPYDTNFWTRVNEFRFFDRAEEVGTFIEKYKIQDYFKNLTPGTDSYSYQLQYPYINWQQDRVLIKEASPEVLEKYQDGPVVERDKYQLGCKLYLDISPLSDTLIYQLRAVIDPIETYYYFPITAIDHVFINLYFDLLEVERRKLDREIQGLEDQRLEAIDALYAQSQQRYKLTTRRYVSEVQRGKNIVALKKWNEKVKEALGIDNMALFQVEVGK
ncbi:MAG: carboxypeptidase-like regulatory domain-containing protein [Bacteroidota bacterium]